MEFGQTPKQLFTKPHKPRYVDVRIKQLSNDVAPLRVGDVSMTYPMCSMYYSHFDCPHDVLRPDDSEFS